MKPKNIGKITDNKWPDGDAIILIGAGPIGGGSNNKEGNRDRSPGE